MLKMKADLSTPSLAGNHRVPALPETKRAQANIDAGGNAKGKRPPPPGCFSATQPRAAATSIGRFGAGPGEDRAGGGSLVGARCARVQSDTPPKGTGLCSLESSCDPGRRQAPAGGWQPPRRGPDPAQPPSRGPEGRPPPSAPPSRQGLPRKAPASRSLRHVSAASQAPQARSPEAAVTSGWGRPRLASRRPSQRSAGPEKPAPVGCCFSAGPARWQAPGPSCPRDAAAALGRCQPGGAALRCAELPPPSRAERSGAERGLPGPARVLPSLEQQEWARRRRFPGFAAPPSSAKDRMFLTATRSGDLKGKAAAGPAPGRASPPSQQGSN
ncbi:proline-rich protein HaeIII subfamily 1-like [Eublepharis macularius]|uniref:Proline-rich protein HaeIII subfamily 1-like n=1 Tax=Eublepharis macularius TaxID=481883 RepID=A0AA97KJT7_EUBMA|nr:proline-rich protein HaeIII subfamily 1-like [Eublepharis macularius]